MIRRLLAVLAAVVIVAAPAAADFTITGTVVYDGTSFSHNGKTIFLLPTGTPGTYTKVTTDAQGRVVSGGLITCADVTTAGSTCTENVGNTGHVLGFLDESKTDSGNNDYTGANTFSGVYGREREITGNDVLTANDCGRTVVATSGSAINLTTFANAAPAGKVCAIMAVQQGAGQLNIVAGGGTTLVNPIGCTRAFGQYAMVSLVVTGNMPSEWKIGGGCLPP